MSSFRARVCRARLGRYCTRTPGTILITIERRWTASVAHIWLIYTNVLFKWASFHYRVGKSPTYHQHSPCIEFDSITQKWKLSPKSENYHQKSENYTRKWKLDKKSVVITKKWKLSPKKWKLHQKVKIRQKTCNFHQKWKLSPKKWKLHQKWN